jgi:hypothetical protein
MNAEFIFLHFIAQVRIKKYISVKTKLFLNDNMMERFFSAYNFNDVS